VEFLESRRLLSLTPQLVAVIDTAPTFSAPGEFLTIGATTYFVADSAQEGLEL